MQLYNKTCSQLCLRRIILKIFAKYMLTCPQHLPLNCWIWGIVLLTDCVCAHECTHSSFVDLEGRARNPWKRIHIRGRRWYHCLWTCVCVCKDRTGKTHWPKLSSGLWVQIELLSGREPNFHLPKINLHLPKVIIVS